jgi:hypothetical protein
MHGNSLGRIGLFFKRNSGTILTILAGAGVVATAILVGIEAPEAKIRVEKKQEEKGEKLDVVETIKEVAPIVYPAAIACTATLICVFGANILNERQQASLISAYALLERSYKEYRKKVLDLYGQKADEEVFCEIAKDHYVIYGDDGDGILVKEGEELFYEPLTDQYFSSTTEKVKDAWTKINREIAVECYVCLNEYLSALGQPEVSGGNNTGWSCDTLIDWIGSCWLDFEFVDKEMDDGTLCHVVYPTLYPDASFIDEWTQ